MTSNSADLRTVLSSRLSHTELRSSRRESRSFLNYLPTPRWHHLKKHPFLAIHPADEHSTIYSFSNTTSYCTFYSFFSSFRITLWPMWLANSKRQPCFYPPVTRTRRHTEKAVPLHAWTGPEGSRKLKFPDFVTTAQDGGKVVSLTHRPPLPPGNTPGTHSVRG